MGSRVTVLVLVCWSALACGDQRGSTGADRDRGAEEPIQLVQRAPEEVNAELAQLLASLDESLPGAATAALSDFLTHHRGYDTDALVEQEIAHYRELSKGRYHAARELARQGEFDRAEAILSDLATYLPDTADGAKALEHLDFGFYMNRAQHLMMRQRFDEAAGIARRMLELDLNPAQAAQAEQILDTVSQAHAAYGMVEQQELKNATRQLLVILATRYVEDGVYPRTFRLSDVEDWDLFQGRSVLRTISRIEGYRAHENAVSFTAVSKSGNHQIEVVESEMRDVRSR